jgi:hypothetical protein
MCRGLTTLLFLTAAALDTHYETIRRAMQGVFQELGLAA